jgi:hypothetical protein
VATNDPIGDAISALPSLRARLALEQSRPVRDWRAISELSSAIQTREAAERERTRPATTGAKTAQGATALIETIAQARKEVSPSELAAFDDRHSVVLRDAEAIVAASEIPKLTKEQRAAVRATAKEHLTRLATVTTEYERLQQSNPMLAAAFHERHENELAEARALEAAEAEGKDIKET